MKFYNTTLPYKVIEHQGIQYSVCRDYSHISRYRNIRQLIHSPNVLEDRFVALETTNPITTNIDVAYYEVLPAEVNRLDVIAYKLLGSPSYAWVIAYFNEITDGYSAYQGQILRYPKAGVTALFTKGEVLSPVNPFGLNLGAE